MDIETQLVTQIHNNLHDFNKIMSDEEYFELRHPLYRALIDIKIYIYYTIRVYIP